LREAADLGVIQAHFSGGEPLLRKDLPDLVGFARKCDLYCDLSTSAYTATREQLAALKEVGLDAIQVSLLDSRKAGNDWVGGTESFEKKCDAIRWAKELGFPVSLNAVLHRHNLDHVEEIIQLALDWEVERLELAHVQYVGWAFRNRAALLPTREQLEHARDVVARMRDEARGRLFILHVLPDFYQAVPKACLQGWGTHFLAVAPDGAVLPCMSAREIPGMVFPTVTEQSLESIWFRSEVFNMFRGVEWLPEPCQSCERRDVDFGGCRCQAFLFTGDAARTDPVCHKTPDHVLVEEAMRLAELPAPAFEHRAFKSGTAAIGT
jgi:pyrroloquinoline quinone biosynthesis protein E